MARYYDLDSLRVSDINVGTVMFPRMERCILLKDIESALTADVVPKSEVENEIADDILRIAEECGGGVLFYRKMCKYAEELKSEINANENNN